MKEFTSAGRRAHIRARLGQQPGLSVAQLAQELRVSEMTIRRDLNALEGQAHVQRTHGGAMLTERMILEFEYRERRAQNQAAKRAIAAEARRLVQPGQRIILDTGTTTLELAALLANAEDLTVITPSLAVASELQHSSGVEVILLGGALRQGSPELTGPVTEHSLELFSADIAFQGADGIGLDGSIYNADLRLANVDKQMRRIAKFSCVLADSSKIGRTALARCGTMRELDLYITDTGAPPAALTRFARLGAKIVTVAPWANPSS